MALDRALEPPRQDDPLTADRVRVLCDRGGVGYGDGLVARVLYTFGKTDRTSKSVPR